MQKNLQDKIKEFFKEKENILLAIILILAFIIRLKYFNYNPSVWWDEGDYMNIAKHWALGLSWDINPVRPILFPLIMAFIYKLGLGDLGARVIMLIFSFGGVLLTYLISKELYDRKIALIATVLFSTFYLHLFLTARFLVGMPATTIWLLTLYCFIHGFIKGDSRKYAILTGIFMAAGFLIRFPSALIFFLILLVLLLKDRLTVLKNKNFWFMGGTTFIFILPYLIRNIIEYGDALRFMKQGFMNVEAGYASGLSGYINMIPMYLTSPIPVLTSISSWFQLLIIILIIGLGVMLFDLVIGWDLLIKSKNRKLSSHFLVLLWIIIILSYFSFFLGHDEPRYLMYLFPAVFIVIALGFMQLYNFICSYNKTLAMIGLIILVLFSAGLQLSYADKLITDKANSFALVNPAGKWLKEHTEKDEIILSNVVQAELTFFAERKARGFGSTPEEALQLIKDNNVKYLVVSGYFPGAQWNYAFPADYNMTPVQVYFVDKERTQPMVIIYEIPEELRK